MSPARLRLVAQALLIAGIAGAVVMTIDLVAPLVSSILVIFLIAFGFALDIRADNATRR